MGLKGGGGGLNCERCSHTAFTDNADCHHVCIFRACPATYASVIIIIHSNNTYRHTFSVVPFPAEQTEQACSRTCTYSIYIY